MSEIRLVLTAAVHDIYVEDDCAAVYVDDEVLVLGPIASALVDWILTEGAQSRATVTQRLIEMFGPPPGDSAEVAIDLQLDALLEARIVEELNRS